ncbi:MAG: NUMOD1 domain-containing DNA-binding protein [Paeniclostridium sordellii]|nr:NUMOD1 domain-containing DNA-binding protein [Paeniclostridium sordellii]
MNYTNTCDFDLTDNYMALLACILDPKLSIGKAVKYIALDDSKDPEGGDYRKVKPKQNHNYKVKVLDEVENKEIEFDNLSNCCEFLNMRRADITTYIKHNRLFKKRYRIRALEPIKTVERKPVIITDTLQNKVLEFESVNKACKHLKANRDNINKAIAAKRLFRKRYKIEYKVGNEKHE